MRPPPLWWAKTRTFFFFHDTYTHTHTLPIVELSTTYPDRPRQTSLARAHPSNTAYWRCRDNSSELQESFTILRATFAKKKYCNIAPSQSIYTVVVVFTDQNLSTLSKSTGRERLGMQNLQIQRDEQRLPPHASTGEGGQRYSQQQKKYRKGHDIKMVILPYTRPTRLAESFSTMHSMSNR